MNWFKEIFAQERTVFGTTQYVHPHAVGFVLMFGVALVLGVAYIFLHEPHICDRYAYNGLKGQYIMCKRTVRLREAQREYQEAYESYEYARKIYGEIREE